MIRKFLLFICILLIAVLCTAQNPDPNVGNGLQPFETFDGEISLDTLNIHLDIPLLTKEGVGLPLSFGMHFNNNFWVPYGLCTNPVQYKSCLNPNGQVWGWLPDAAQGTGAFIVRPGWCAGSSNYNFLKYMGYIDPNGNTHPIYDPADATFGIVDQTNATCGDHYPSQTVIEPDGSGYTFVLTYPQNAEAHVGPFPASGGADPTVITSDGTVLSPGLVYYDSGQEGTQVWNPSNFISGTSIVDTNSNSITIPAQQSWPAKSISPAGPYVFTDTFNVGEVTIAPEVFVGPGNALFSGPAGPAGPCASSANETYTYPTASGTATATIVCKAYNIQTNFGCYYDYDFPRANNTSTYTAYLIDTITLGDNVSQYKFTYESQATGTVTGRLASILYPDGSLVSYAYFTPAAGNVNPPGYTYFSQGTSCLDGSVIGLTRTDSSGTWTYTRNTAAFTTTVQSPAPANNVSVYTFDSKEGAFGATLLVQEQDYQGQNTLLKTETYCYNGNQTNCTTATGISYGITQKDTYTQLAGMSTSSRLTKKYDTYSNVTETDVYDFGASTPTTKVVITGFGKTWTGSTSSPTCTTIGSGINNVPCQVETFDHTGSTAIRNAFFTYDSNGNNLSSAIWASGTVTAGRYLTSSTTYNLNGTVATISDLNGNFDSITWGNCSGGRPSVVTSGSFVSRVDWDLGCKGAVLTKITDFNGNSTTSSYNDPFWSLTSFTDELGNSITRSYTPTSIEATFGTVSDNFSQIFPTTLKSISQLREGSSSSNWDTVESGYSWGTTGITDYKTQPCSYKNNKGKLCVGGVKTTSTHDALGRELLVTDGGGGTVTSSYNKQDILVTVGPAPVGEVVKQVQTEYDGFGRLLTSCQLSSTAPGHMSCGQVNGGSGILTTSTYNDDGTEASAVTGAQTHSFTYDRLGRILTTTYPESGETQYFYDSAPSSPGVACSGLYLTTNSNPLGNLLKIYDANGNTTCFSYDTHNRVASIAYSGPNFDGKNKYFVYDSATVNGVVMKNVVGRLAEAYTSTTQTGTKVTDEGFSYTARGELSDVYEKTPNSGGYYHTAATYYPNGVLNSISGIAGGPWTYSIDAMGRPYGVTGGSVALTDSTTYDAAGNPLTIAYSNGDKDVYSYDPNTGRMSTYGFYVGNSGQSQIGALTYNANGTLRQLSVVDKLNAGGTHYCNYGTSSVPGYDDLGRLVNVNCTADPPGEDRSTVWTQVFSYDQYNNITKTGTNGGTSWNPGYSSSPSNNRYTLAGTTYDSNGNLLTDSFHTYTWNQNGKISGVTDQSITTTYDALGILVEKYNGSVYNQSILSPIGNLGVWNNKNVSQYRIPVPGGATATTGINFWHKDWLGSVPVISSKGGRAVVSDKAFAPYGETFLQFGNTANVNFTGDDQDLIPGLFDTPERELDPTQGRWLSPDPGRSSWNAYAYSTNPLSIIDSTGGQDDQVDGFVNGEIGTYTAFDFPLCTSSGDCAGGSDVVVSISFNGGGGGGGGTSSGNSYGGLPNPTPINLGIPDEFYGMAGAAVMAYGSAGADVLKGINAVQNFLDLVFDMKHQLIMPLGFEIEGGGGSGLGWRRGLRGKGPPEKMWEMGEDGRYRLKQQEVSPSIAKMNAEYRESLGNWSRIVYDLTYGEGGPTKQQASLAEKLADLADKGNKQAVAAMERMARTGNIPSFEIQKSESLSALFNAIAEQRRILGVSRWDDWKIYSETTERMRNDDGIKNATSNYFRIVNKTK